LTAFSSRHSGDLGGRLTPFADAHQLAVRIHISEVDAPSAAAQHVASMLVNMLSRLEGVVKSVAIDCPTRVPLAGRVAPLSHRDEPLDQALVGMCKRIGVVPLGTSPSQILIHVGREAESGADLNVYGEAWWGGIFTHSVAGTGESALPFGPYIAAAIATGEIFKLARILPSKRTARRDVFFSAWSHIASALPDTGGPNEITSVLEKVGLAGVGAVGCAFLHALWAMDAVGTLEIADNDAHGVEDTNLNRYCLFGANSIGKQKAFEAQRILSDARFRINASDKSFDVLYDQQPNRFDLVVSAVDSNEARAMIQDKYPPVTLSASTLDLRAEVLRCGPPGEGACLRCFNPPPMKPSDEELRVSLSQMPAKLAAMVGELVVSSDEAREWVESGKCSETGSRMLEMLQRNHREPLQFAVPFVSVMAGTLLAAETIKQLAGGHGCLDGQTNRVSIQFFDPLARGNARTFLGRDHRCPKCADGPALQIWKTRFKGI